MLASAAAKLLRAHAAGNLAEARELQEGRIDPWCGRPLHAALCCCSGSETAQRFHFCERLASCHVASASELALTQEPAGGGIVQDACWYMYAREQACI